MATIRQLSIIYLMCTSAILLYSISLHLESHYYGSIMSANILDGPVHKKLKCSFKTFGQIAMGRPDGYIPGNGLWTRHSNQTIDRFFPAVCKLRYGQHIPHDILTECFQKKMMKHIIVIGDSNGRLNFDALYRHLSGGKKQCTPIQHHAGINYQQYSKAHVVHHCTCPNGQKGLCTMGSGWPQTDSVIQSRCDFGNRSIVYLEYTTLRRTIEPKRSNYSIGATGCQLSSNGSVFPTMAATTQEFLLKEFFAEPQPDLIIVFGNAHDAQPLVEFDKDVNQFAELIDKYVKQPTKLIWTSKFAEYQYRKPSLWRFMKYGANKTLTRYQYLDAANRILYRKMRERFLIGDRLLMFPDLLGMSEPVLRDFNRDGVHMRPQWYDYAMSFMLQSICEI